VRVPDVKHRRATRVVVEAVHALHLRAVPAQPPAVGEFEIDGRRQAGLARFDALAKRLSLRPRLGPARSSTASCAAAALALALVCCAWGCVVGGNRRERLADDDGRELVIVTVTLCAWQP